MRFGTDAMDVRTRCLNSLTEALAPRSSSLHALRRDAVELEHAAFASCQGHSAAYPLTILRALRLVTAGRLQDLRHLDPQTPRAYAELLRLPAREVHHRVPCAELCEQARRLRDQAGALLRDLSSPDLSHIPDAGTRCAKCHSSEIAFDFLQTRSADEGTTVYCNCTACGKRWKM